MSDRVDKAAEIAVLSVWVFISALFVAATAFIGIGTIIGCLYFIQTILSAPSP